jgi:hypothetical protein
LKCESTFEATKPENDFLLAIALWMRNDAGDRDKSRERFETGERLLKENAPGRADAIRVRTIAANLLGKLKESVESDSQKPDAD